MNSKNCYEQIVFLLKDPSTIRIPLRQNKDDYPAEFYVDELKLPTVTDWSISGNCQSGLTCIVSGLKPCDNFPFETYTIKAKIDDSEEFACRKSDLSDVWIVVKTSEITLSNPPNEFDRWIAKHKND